MKKKLFILILAFLGIFSLIGCAGSEYDTTSIVTDNYNIDFTFNDDIMWDLDTGLYEDNTNFCSTSREQLFDTNITLNDYTKADYLLIWNNNNNYIGYYTLAGAYQGGDRFLGDISSDSITLPASAFKVALMNDKLGVNGYFKWGSSYLSYTYDHIISNPVIAGLELESIDDYITVEGYETLTYRDVFGDSLYGTGKTNINIPVTLPYQNIQSSGTYIGTYTWLFNSSHTLDNNIIYMQYEFENDIDSDLGMFFVTSPTRANYAPNLYETVEELHIFYGNVFDYTGVNLYRSGLSYTPPINSFINKFNYWNLTTLFSGYDIPSIEEFETMLAEYERITSISSDGIYLGDIDNTLEEYYNLDSDAEIDYALSLMDNNVDYYNYDNLINDTNYYANITEDIADNYIYKSANDGVDSAIDYGIDLEQLVVDGDDLSNYASYWSSVSVTVDGTTLDFYSAIGNDTYITRSDLAIVGTKYAIAFDLVITSGSLRLTNGGENTVYSTSGSYVNIKTATTTQIAFGRQSSAVENDFNISNIRVIPITDTSLENLTASEIEDIGLPYFEGEQTIYNPTITTLGVNLFDINSATGTRQDDYENPSGTVTIGIYNDTINAVTTTLFDGVGVTSIVKSGEDYTYSYDSVTNVNRTRLTFLDIDMNVISAQNISNGDTVTTPSNAVYVEYAFLNTTGGVSMQIVEPQIEEGTVATTYEEYYPATNIFNMTDMYSEYESYLTAETVNNYLDTDLNSIQNYDLSTDTNSDGLADNFSDNLTDITDNTLSTFTYFNTMMNENITNGQYVKAINVAQDYNGDTTEDGILLEYIGLTSEINDYTTNIVSLEIDGITDCSIAVLVGYYDKDDTGIVKWGYSIITPIDTDGIYYFDFENDNGLTATYDYYTIRFNVIDSLGSLSFVGNTESFILKSLGLYDSYEIFKDIIDTNLQTYHYIEEMTFPDVADTDYNDYFLYNDLGNETATTGNFNLLANYGVDDNVYFITFTEEAITDYIDIYYNDTFNSTTNFSYDDYFTYFNSMNMLDYQYLFNYSDTEMYQDLYTERDYILSLYWDYKNNVDRWEWYQDYGINNLNYTIFMNEYDERVLETNPLSLDSLDDITATTTYDIIVEEEEDIITNFEEFLQSITGESAFIYKVIIVIVILVTVIGLALLKADFMILTFITITELLFFVLIGWLSNWIALFIGIIAFILLLLKFKGVGGSGE